MDQKGLVDSARLRLNKVILVDNTPWTGAVVDLNASGDYAQIIRAFNDTVAADDR